MYTQKEFGDEYVSNEKLVAYKTVTCFQNYLLKYIGSRRNDYEISKALGR